MAGSNCNGAAAGKLFLRISQVTWTMSLVGLVKEAASIWKVTNSPVLRSKHTPLLPTNGSAPTMACEALAS